jgi:uncharacterized membrane-anchored protein YitT (DUF2179 family)
MGTSSRKIKRRIATLFAIAIGTAIMGFGINCFNIANNLAEGGVAGIAILLKLALDWNPGLTLLAINLPLFVVGWFTLGRRSLLLTAWGTVCLAFFLWVFDGFRFPLDDLLLAALFAGVSLGLGLGIVFRFGGTTGGVDIVARVCHKYLGWKIGRTMFFADVAVIGISLTYLELPQAMYTGVVVFVGTRLIDTVQDAAYSARAVTIVSRASREIAAQITSRLDRGATLLEGRGAYTGERREMLYVVVGRSEVVRLKNLVRRIDPGAFLSVAVASEVVGEGFAREDDGEAAVA